VPFSNIDIVIYPIQTGFVALIATVTFPSGQTASAQGNPSTDPRLRMPQAFTVTTFNSSYTAASEADLEGEKLGESEATVVGVSVNGGVPLSENSTWTWGLGSQNLFMGTIHGSPIPERAHTFSLSTGFNYRHNERWMFTGFVSTSLYRFDSIGSDSFGFSGGVIASYQANAALKWNLGLVGSPDSDIPVLPVVGANWMINDQWSLDLGIPKTRLSYRTGSNWIFHTGLDMVGTTFLTDTDFASGAGSSEYNDTVAAYRDIRLGVGVSYQFASGLRAELEGGTSIYRRLDYTDLDREVEFDPSAYVRLGLAFRF